MISIKDENTYLDYRSSYLPLEGNRLVMEMRIKLLVSVACGVGIDVKVIRYTNGYKQLKIDL